MAAANVTVVGGLFREIHETNERRELRYAGSGLTSAIAAARMGARVELVGFVGAEDEDAFRTILGAAGVSSDSLLVLPGASGTFVFPALEDETRPWPLYRPAESTPREIIKVAGGSVTLVFGQPDFDVVAEGWLSDLQAESTLLWDRQGWLSRARDAEQVIQLPPKRKILLANEDEALGERSKSSVAELLRSEPPVGFACSVIKHGRRGVSICIESRTPLSVAAYPTSTRSSIGSGDMFAGILAARLASDDSIPDAARWACAGAAVGLESGTGQVPPDGALQIRKLLAQDR